MYVPSLLLSCLLVPPATRPALSFAIDEEISQAELEEITADIVPQVEELRGLDFDQQVAVSVTDREGFLAYAKARIEQTTTPEELAAAEVSAKLLGLIPADMDFLATMIELLEEQVGGFYDPQEERFFLMSSFDGGVARVILAHELVHALDDQHFDIDGKLETCKGNADAAFAFQAVVEGCATAVMNQWTMQNFASLDLSDLAKVSEMGADSMAEAPPYLWKPLLAAYLRGAAFVQKSESVMAMGAADPDDLDRAFRDPPRSSEQILHPEKYWDEESFDPPVEVSIELAELSEGWEVMHEDTFGELQLALVCDGDMSGLTNPMASLGLKYTNDAATGWGGDRWVLLARGDAHVLVLHSVWDTPEDAEEFRSTLADRSRALTAAAEATARQAELESGAFLVEAREGGVLVASASGLDRAGLVALLEGLRVTTSR